MNRQDHLILPHPQGITDGFDDAVVGLMGDEVGNIGCVDMVFGQDLFDIFGQGLDRQLEGLVPFHLYILQPCVKIGLIHGVNRSRCRGNEHIGIGTVCTGMDVNDRFAFLFRRGDNRRPGTVTKENTRPPIGPVHDGTELLRSDDQNIFFHSRFDKGSGD